MIQKFALSLQSADLSSGNNKEEEVCLCRKGEPLEGEGWGEMASHISVFV